MELRQEPPERPFLAPLRQLITAVLREAVRDLGGGEAGLGVAVKPRKRFRGGQRQVAGQALLRGGGRPGAVERAPEGITRARVASPAISCSRPEPTSSPDATPPAILTFPSCARRSPSTIPR